MWYMYLESIIEKLRLSTGQRQCRESNSHHATIYISSSRIIGRALGSKRARHGEAPLRRIYDGKL